MEIRIATEQDVKYMMSSRIEMLRVVNHLPADYCFGDAFLERSEDYFRHGDHTTVLALEEDEVVGCATICYITVMPTFDHPSGSRAHIINVYTRASYRRRGIGRSMPAVALQIHARGWY